MSAATQAPTHEPMNGRSHMKTAAPGLCVMGLRFMRRRKSNFIDGQVADAAELSEHLLSRRRPTSSAA